MILRVALMVVLIAVATLLLFKACQAVYQDVKCVEAGYDHAEKYEGEWYCVEFDPEKEYMAYVR